MLASECSFARAAVHLLAVVGVGVATSITAPLEAEAGVIILLSDVRDRAGVIEEAATLRVEAGRGPVTAPLAPPLFPLLPLLLLLSTKAGKPGGRRALIAALCCHSSHRKARPEGGSYFTLRTMKLVGQRHRLRGGRSPKSSPMVFPSHVHNELELEAGWGFGGFCSGFGACLGV